MPDARTTTGVLQQRIRALSARRSSLEAGVAEARNKATFLDAVVANYEALARDAESMAQGFSDSGSDGPTSTSGALQGSLDAAKSTRSMIETGWTGNAADAFLSQTERLPTRLASSRVWITSWYSNQAKACTTLAAEARAKAGDFRRQADQARQTASSMARSINSVDQQIRGAQSQLAAMRQA